MVPGALEEGQGETRWWCRVVEEVEQMSLGMGVGGRGAQSLRVPACVTGRRAAPRLGCGREGVEEGRAFVWIG